MLANMFLLVLWIVAWIAAEGSFTELIETNRREERVALAKLLNSTGSGHITPASFADTACPVCIPPMVIGGGIAAAVAGIAGLGLAGFGMGAIGGVLGMGALKSMGAFDSHKMRRRKKDERLPCESTEPLDTNDKDCFSYRWDKLIWYFPRHSFLKRLDRVTITAQDELAAMGRQIFLANEKNEDSAFGFGGSYLHPSRNKGLFFESQFLTAVTQFLESVMNRDLHELQRTQSGQDDDAVSDVKELRGEIIQEFADLHAAVVEVLDKQKASHDFNEGRMNQRATALLRDRVIDLITGQQLATENLIDVGRDATVTSSQFRTAAKDNEWNAAQMEKAGNQLERRLISATDDLKLRAETREIEAVGKVLDKFHVEKERLDHDASELVYAFSEATNDEQSRANTLLTQLVKPRVAGLIMNVTDLDKFVGESELKTTNVLGEKASNFSTSLAVEERKILNTTKDGEQAIRSTQRFLEWLVTDADLASLLSDKSAFDVDLRAQLDEVKQTALKLTSSGSGMSKGAIAAIVGAIGTASTDARGMLQMGESEYNTRISEIMRMVGVDSFNASGLFRNVTSSLAFTSTKADRQVGESYDAFFADAPGVGTKLLSAADSLAKAVRSHTEGDKKLLLADVAGVDGAIADGGAIVDRAIANARIPQILASNASISSEERMTRNAQKLTAAGRGIDSSVLSTSEFIDLFSENSKAELSSLARVLAAAADDTGNVMANKAALTQQAVSAALVDTVYGPHGLDATTKSVIREILNRQKRVNQLSADSQNQAKAAVSSTGSAMQSLQRLARQTETDPSEREREKLAELVGEQLTRLTGKEAVEFSKNSETFVGTLETVSGYVTALQAGRKLDVQHEQERIANDAKSIATAAAALGNVMGNIVDSVDDIATESRVQERMHDGVSAFETEMKELFGISVADVRALTYRFIDMKQIVASGVDNVTSALRREVMELPEELTNGTVAAEERIRFFDSDLRNKLRVARERLAPAVNETERLEATQSIVLLTKIQAVQEGLRQADIQIRAGIGSAVNTSGEHALDLHHRVTELMEDVVAVSARVDGVETAVVEKQILEISKSIKPLLAIVGDEERQAAAESALEQSVWFRKSQADATHRETGIRDAVSQMSSVAAKTFNATEVLAETSRGLMKRFAESHADGSSGLSELAQRVLSEVMDKSTAIESNATLSEAESVERTAAVTYAMDQFHTLWRELAMALRKQAMAIRASDSEWLNRTLLESARLQTGASRTWTHVSGDLRSFLNFASAVGEEESRVEEVMDADLHQQRLSLEKSNQQRFSSMLNLTAALGQAIDSAAHTSASTAEQVQTMIDTTFY